MAFLDFPIKSVQATVNSVTPTETMPWDNPLQYPVIPPNLPPAPIPRAFRWRLTISVLAQLQSASKSRFPGRYNGMDINVGDWVANLTTGQAWQIISVEGKTQSNATIIVQDIHRYNTFRDKVQNGNGSPVLGVYVVFELGATGAPQIDPVPTSGASADFATNLKSRFEYINTQYDYALYQQGNTFVFNDVISVDSGTNSFVLSDASHLVPIGRVTSVSDTIPGWFTINPVQKIVDNLDVLPGGVGDVIYTSTTVPGGITLAPGGSQIYIKLRDQTSSTTQSAAPGPTVPGNILQINDVNVTISSPGNANEVVIATNGATGQTGVSATLGLAATSVETSIGNITPLYGEVLLWAATSPATAMINGVSITFNILSTSPGYGNYSRAVDMVTAINNAAIPNILAETVGPYIKIINSVGGSITIVNNAPDINGVHFAGSSSGSGLTTFTPASTTQVINFTAIDSRAIEFLDVVGNTTVDFGLISVENGTKAAGLYIESGLRAASSTVVANLTQLNALTPLVGDSAYVIDSDDGNGNNVNEWSNWIYDGLVWVQTGNQDSASTDAKSLEYTVTTASPASINIGEISTGRRVFMITVEVITPFDGPAELEVGYSISNPTPPPPVPAGLMTSQIIDLTSATTYTTSTDILFGTDTPQGDVTVTAGFTNAGSTLGEAQIIVSYV